MALACYGSPEGKGGRCNIGWRTFNDRLALFLLVVIPALWFLTGYKIIELAPEVTGALIATWTLVVSYYFRKKPPSNGDNRGNL